MASEQFVGGTTGGVSGAATGAAVGFQFGGPYGAVIGGVIGGVAGTVQGVFGGSKKAKAKKYQRMAAQVQQQREANQDSAKFLQLVRQQRIARASAIAEAVATGTETTSKTTGTISGQQSQTGYAINFLAEDKRLQTLYNAYMRMASKAASIAKDIDAGWSATLTAAMPFAVAGATSMGAAGAAGGAGGAGGAGAAGTAGGAAASSAPTGAGVGTFTSNPVIAYG